MLGLVSILGFSGVLGSANSANEEGLMFYDETNEDYDYNYYDKNMDENSFEEFYDEIENLNGMDESYDYYNDNGNDNDEIKNGYAVTPNEYPSIVWIGNCGGSIISPNYVITAAHCIKKNKQKVTVVAGEHILGKTEGTEQTVTGIGYRHPKYRGPNTLWKTGYDVAYIKLDKPLHFNRYVNRIPLAKTIADATVNPGDHLGIAGWGSKNGGGNKKYSKELNEMFVLPVNDKKCNKHFKLNGKIDKQINCVVGMEKQKQAGACHGDDGGPVYIFKKDGRVMQVGITSFFKKGCVGYSAYMEIPFFFKYFARATKLSGRYLNAPVRINFAPQPSTVFKNTDWTCIPGVKTPIRMHNGNVECMSGNKKRCFAVKNHQACHKIVTAKGHKHDKTSLACGAKPRRWCTKGQAYFANKANWRCLRGVKTPLRYVKGKVECMSKDKKTCVRNCAYYVGSKNRAFNKTSLSCDRHRSIWGSQARAPRWCLKGLRYFR